MAAVSTGEGADPVTLLADVDDLEITAVDDPKDATAGPDGVDCVVCGDLPTDGDDLRAVLDEIRTRNPALPVVFASIEPDPPLVSVATHADRVDVVPVEPPAAGARLGHRIRTLVAHARSEDRAERAASAAAAASDGLAVVAEDGTVAFANRSFARLFDATPGTIRGRAWQSLFESGAVSRLESEALAAVDDGWEWLGTCEGRRENGEPVALQVRLADVEDGAFVLAASRSRSDSTDGFD